MPSATPSRWPSGAALWANMAVIYVVWGSTYFGIAIAIETMPPFLMAAIRFGIAGLILLAFDLLRHPEARRWPTRRQLRDSAIVGGLLLGVGNGFVVFGQSLQVPSGVAAILIAMMPLWFALLGWLYLRERLPRLVVGAIAVGFAGTALLIWPGGDGANSFDPLGVLILLLAPLGWAHGSIYSQRRAQLPPSPLTASGIQMLAGGAVTFAEALVTGEPARFHPEAISTASLLALVYLIFIGSMLAYTSYAWLLRNAPLSLVGTYAYVNPVVAVGLGTLFLGETLSVRTIVASAIILAAVAIIVTTRSRLPSVQGDDEKSEAAAGTSASPSSPAPRRPAGSPLREHRPADSRANRHVSGRLDSDLEPADDAKRHAAPRPDRGRLWANMAVIYVVWGSTYFGIAIAIETMPPFLMAAIRFAIAGLILLAFDLLRHPEARRCRRAGSCATRSSSERCSSGVGNGFVVFGQSLEVPSGIAAILVETMPFWFALLGWLYFRERLPRVVLGAIALGFVGTMLLIWPAGEGANRFDPLGILFLLLAELGWAHGSIYSQRRAQLPASPLTASSIQMFAGAAVMVVEAVVSGEPARFQPEAISSASLLALAYLIVFGSMLAYTSYAWLLRNAPLSLVGTYAYVNPVVAIALGTLFLARAAQRTNDRVVRDHPRRRGDHRDCPRPAPDGAAGRRGGDGGGLGPTGGGRDGRGQALEALGRERLAAQRPVLAVAERVVGLDERVELARALVDHRGLGVAQVALDRELVRVAVRAVDLDRVERAGDRVVGRVPLRERRLARVPDAVVLQEAGAPDEEPAGLDPGEHLREHLLHELVLADLVAERLALVGVLERGVEAGLREAHVARRRPCTGPGRSRSSRSGSPRPPRRSGARPPTRTSSMLMSPVLPARIPSLPWSVPVDRPFMPRSSTNAVTPRWPFDRSTEAKTRKWSATSARLIQIFWPFRTYESPSRRAVEARLPASVPTPGLGQPERRQLLALRLGDEPALPSARRSPTA